MFCVAGNHTDCDMSWKPNPKVEWLQDTLGFTRKQSARVVYANPGVLLSSVEGSLMPKIWWLAEALQMDEDMIFDMIRRRVVWS